MADSTQKKLERVRPPRIQISYEVETGGAIEMKELPFLMGVLGDFSGNPTEPLPRLKDRKFVEITPDNFDDTLATPSDSPFARPLEADGLRPGNRFCVLPMEGWDGTTDWTGFKISSACPRLKDWNADLMSSQRNRRTPCRCSASTFPSRPGLPVSRCGGR